MSKQRDLLSSIATSEFSNRKLGQIFKLSHNTVRRYREAFKDNGLNICQIEKLDDAKIDSLFNKKRGRIESKRVPDWPMIHKQMQHKHMTLQLLWEEYSLENPHNAYSYSHFTFYYRQYVSKLDLTMRQTHRAGEMVYVDFAGQTLFYTDANTGQQHKVQIFVGVLGCSNYTFAYAVPTQSIRDWIDAHNKMYYFFGGVTQIVVPDNLKSAVTRPVRNGNEPVLSRTYLEQSKHYRIYIIPARVRKPQDKSKAELGVLFVSRWILPVLRRRQFFSIDEINKAISELLIKLNERPFKQLPGCRRSRFEELDKPFLNPLPAAPFEYAEWIGVRKVGVDYHLPVEKHFYSVPCELVGQKVETRTTKNVIEFIHKGKRVASHTRRYDEGSHTTLPAHQPKAHREYANQTPEKFLEWAQSIGESSSAVIQYQFSCRPHPFLGLKSCSSLKRLAKSYGSERFEAACQRAQAIGSLTVKSVQSILKRNMVSNAIESNPIQMNLPMHDNLRGSDYYMGGQL